MTSTFGIAMPLMSMPVLFDEISEELGLSVVQVGTVWGMFPLGGILLALIGGMLCDRFGTRLTLGISCLLSGLFGAARGLSGDFITLAATMLLFGFPAGVLPLVMPKAIGTWFQGRNLSIALSIASISMALGFTLGTLLSATVFSPLLGGWRNVIFSYGGISIVLGFLWFLTRANPGTVEASANNLSTISFRQATSHVFRIRAVWLLAIILLGHASCVQGMLGYLPLYLRKIGWIAASADGAAASFHVASIIATIPIALLSNKLASRKVVIYATLIMTTIGVALLSVVSGSMIWLLVIIAGIFRDGFMAIFMTTLVETEGVGATYAGTAMGLILTFVRLGEFVSPPIGNSLANISLSSPFLLWGFLAVIALVASYFLKETARG
ncbi:CynX/NimT family MFS transporter [Chloroflexota bacterium]